MNWQCMCLMSRYWNVSAKQMFSCGLGSHARMDQHSIVKEKWDEQWGKIWEIFFISAQRTLTDVIVHCCIISNDTHRSFVFKYIERKDKIWKTVQPTFKDINCSFRRILLEISRAKLFVVLLFICDIAINLKHKKIQDSTSGKIGANFAF